VSIDELSLGATIRAWRDRLPPAAVGLPARRSGRAPGLRREDLAQLAGVSVDYVVRLEQGRATAPSPQVVASLARALQLTTTERDHLYRLAGLRPPARGLVTEHVPPGMQRILARLGDAPTAVFAADWRLVWWNRSWSALLGDPRKLLPAERNLVRSRFPTAADERRLTRWPVVSVNAEVADRAVVADLRRATAKFPGDPALAELVRCTIAGNERFAQLWQEGTVGDRRGERKTIHHPTVGELTVDCDVLVDTDSFLKIVVYTAPTPEDATKLQFAILTGSETGSGGRPGTEHSSMR
jgi:transcriptional regulator with XRE-family HTH domain